MNRNHVIKISEANILNWQHTPWDQKAFNINTAEITDFDSTADKEAIRCVKRFEIDSDAQFLYGRIRAADQIGKLALLTNGFDFCEASVTVSLNRLQTYQLPQIYNGRLLPLDTLKERDVEGLKQAVKTSFKFSRFHENPKLKRSCCEQRMSLWVEDLWCKEVNCYVYRNTKGEVLSFMFYELEDLTTVKLVLGGSLLGYGMYSPFFWASVLVQLQKLNLTKVTTSISLANTGVMSLYQNLRFKFVEVKYDFQKLKV